ncbi:DUF3781 domain-containing protein [Levilactobacillus acidifarinae]|uniref:DUF3781 domain-containing protein n=1 Tax=Levilactobacillus acidifarinae DSM 19394 = JCM 15949 TaxID=1423715 RepID=A0A0R1LGI3_9LACO|nr:DUF3781 domain-containing protein [Levilactobacillus acidifarinae]KRK95003.1 hypothetical protein FD25_GL002188 [Levilactobacillus acidifarinae DSM 19394]GEO70774.1 hypothetical protein LAC03_26840 [Levilactobacillus acidifarinae]
MPANPELLASIKNQVCYTDLVYQRVNKKLKVDFSRSEIEKLVQDILSDDQTTVEKQGKNYYVSGLAYSTRLTINSFNFRLIAADRL